MADSGNDKSGIGERLGGVMMASEIAAPTMRDDDERQIVAIDGAIPYPRQSGVAEFDLARWFGTRIPHRSVQSRAAGASRHIDGTDAHGVGERCRETKTDRDWESGSAHRCCPPDFGDNPAAILH